MWYGRNARAVSFALQFTGVTIFVNILHTSRKPKITLTQRVPKQFNVRISLIVRTATSNKSTKTHRLRPLITIFIYHFTLLKDKDAR